MRRSYSYYNINQFIPIIYIGVGVYFINKLVEGFGKAATSILPEGTTPTQSKSDKGLTKVSKTGKGLNLIRGNTDQQLQQLVSKLKVAFADNDQTAIQNVFINVKTDADLAYMSELFGQERYSYTFQYLNMWNYFQKVASKYTKDRINQSWLINKKFPTRISMKL